MRCRPSILVLLFTLVGALHAETLSLTRTIPLPDVSGRIDHFALDAANARLFIAALGNNTVEVIDLKQGKIVRSLGGMSEPQGVAFAPELNRLYVANGGDGALRIFDGTTFVMVASIPLGDDADNVRYDGAARRIYVGYGNGALGIVDATKNTLVGRVKLAGHPESFQLDAGGPNIFVNVPHADHVAVVDRAREAVVATWKLNATGGNFPLALDAATQRVFVGCRSPACVLVLDARSGRELARRPLHGDCDDLFFDASRRRLYASCGEGFIDVFALTDADHAPRVESIATIAKARTCFFDGEQIFLAVPRRGNQSAEVRIFHVQ